MTAPAKHIFLLARLRRPFGALEFDIAQVIGPVLFDLDYTFRVMEMAGLAIFFTVGQRSGWTGIDNRLDFINGTLISINPWIA